MLIACGTRSGEKPILKKGVGSTTSIQGKAGAGVDLGLLLMLLNCGAGEDS